MLPPFDIFKIEASGDVLRIKPAADLKSARLAVKELIASSPTLYVIHSHSTNNDLVIRPATEKRIAKPVIFQIAYDEQLMAARAEVLKTHGFAVISVLGNEAAKGGVGHASVLFPLLSRARCEPQGSNGNGRLAQGEIS